MQKKMLTSSQLETCDKRYFRLVRQPRDLFYKDEGGKGNYLTCIFKLCFGAKYMGERKLTKPVRVTPSLYYESGLRVEDSDQSILELIGYNEFKGQLEPMYVDTKTLEVEVKYRLTKVSRRKDNQRFKLCLAAVLEDSSDCSDIYHALSAATQVLSKRKKQALDSGELKTGDVSPRPNKRVRILKDQLVKMQSTMDQLVSLLKTQNKTISNMEAQLMFSRRPSFSTTRVRLGDQQIPTRRHSFTPDANAASSFRGGGVTTNPPPILGRLCANSGAKSNTFLPPFLTGNSVEIAQLDSVQLPGQGAMLRGISDLIAEEFGAGKQTSVR